MNKRPRVSKAAKLLARLRDELKLDLPENARIERTRAGHWQRSAGAFVWIVLAEGSPFLSMRVVGSQYTVTELIRAAHLEVDRSFGDIGICPADQWRPRDDAGGGKR